MARYDRVAFGHSDDHISAADPPDLMAPGHPLVSALAEAVGHEFGFTVNRGIILFDNRYDLDYVLVSATRVPDGSPAALDTYPVAGGNRQAVSPDLYTGLQVDSVPIAHEVAAADAAVAQDVANGMEVAAVAYVRGTASPASAAAWRAAREELHDELTAKDLDFRSGLGFHDT